VLALNLLAPFELVKSLLPALRAATTQDDPARIINLSSIDGIALPIWECYPYSASKAGVIQLTRHLGKFLADDNICVNAIAPGIFRSRMTTGVLDFDDPADLAAIGGRSHETIEVVVGSRPHI
jgi:NAD(P)-dependent dehydrogenase (short-subunit alcohol dehydrogenase family)